MNVIKVNNLEIGGDRTFIIADVGSNHMQDTQLAKDSIDAVVEAGADAVKFQSIQLNELYHLPNAVTTSFIKKLEFPEEWHLELNQYCKEKGIIFFSSPTYLRAVDLLEEIDAPLYKLASAQIGTFPQMVERVASLRKPTLFSTGIANYEEVTQAVRIFEKMGNDKYMILHCNSIYPAPANMINMPLMDTYKSMFNCPVGFSDHSNGIHVSLAAVARGAKVIEKHFTLDKNFDTPDSTSFAADPLEFKMLVDQIREVEAALTRREPRLDIQAEEIDFKNSIIYRAKLKRDVAEGQEVTYDDIDYSRCTEGIDAREAFFNRTFGRAKTNLKKGVMLKYEHLINS